MKDSSKFATLALAGLLTVGLASSTFAGDNHDEKSGCKATTGDPQKDKKKSKGGSSCSSYSCAVGF